MRADEVPQDILDLLDARAGKEHSHTGAVVACLAEILTVDRARHPRISPDRMAFLWAKVQEHTRQCGPHDYGMVFLGCACAGDPRWLLLELLRELEALTAVDSGHTPG